MAGSQRQLMLIRCRQQQGFANLQEVAADGGKVSLAFKRALPMAGSRRQLMLIRYRRQHVFTDLQKAAAGGGRFS